MLTFLSFLSCHSAETSQLISCQFADEFNFPSRIQTFPDESFVQAREEQTMFKLDFGNLANCTFNTDLEIQFNFVLNPSVNNDGQEDAPIQIPTNRIRIGDLKTKEITLEEIGQRLTSAGTLIDKCLTFQMNISVRIYRLDESFIDITALEVKTLKTDNDRKVLNTDGNVCSRQSRQDFDMYDSMKEMAPKNEWTTNASLEVFDDAVETLQERQDVLKNPEQNDAGVTEEHQVQAPGHQDQTQDEHNDLNQQSTQNHPDEEDQGMDHAQDTQDQEPKDQGQVLEPIDQVQEPPQDLQELGKEVHHAQVPSTTQKNPEEAIARHPTLDQGAIQDIQNSSKIQVSEPGDQVLEHQDLQNEQDDQDLQTPSLQKSEEDLNKIVAILATDPPQAMDTTQEPFKDQVIQDTTDNPDFVANPIIPYKHPEETIARRPILDEGAMQDILDASNPDQRQLAKANEPVTIAILTIGIGFIALVVLVAFILWKKGRNSEEPLENGFINENFRPPNGPNGNVEIFHLPGITEEKEEELKAEILEICQKHSA